MVKKANGFDVIVLGLGAMGSASVYQLAKAGVKVLGVDQFRPPHGWGSSHGETRITRQAVGEGSAYVPLVLRSNEIWQELERVTNKSLYVPCGGIILSPDLGIAEHHGQTDFLKKTIEIAKAYDIKHDVLEAKDVEKRFPQFGLEGNELAYFEYGTGYLKPEACIEAQLSQAEKYDATLAFDEKVIDIKYYADFVKVITDKTSYEAEQLVCAAGPWMSDFLTDEYKNLLKVYRQILYWFEIDSNMKNDLESSPIFMWLYGDGAEDYFYGFPSSKNSNLVKVSTGKYFSTTNPTDIDRTVSHEEISGMYERSVFGRIKGVMSSCKKADVCMYTVTPDSGFIIDRLPRDERVIAVSACSGHGFKHSSAIGEVVSSLIRQESTPVEMDAFSFKRFS